METSAVRKESETFSFQTLGRFETVGSNLRYGIPKGFATVRPHLRKVSDYSFYSSGRYSRISPGWDLALARILAIILMVSTQFGIFLYLVLAFLLPYKEDIYPEIKLKDGRKRKNAEPVEDEWNW